MRSSPAEGCDVARYFCCDERRRDAVQAHATVNGIDFVEVVDDPAMPDDQRQRTIRVFFVKPLQQAKLFQCVELGTLALGVQAAVP